MPGFSLDEGARIAVKDWCQVRPQEKVLIVSDELHGTESMALWKAAQNCGAVTALLTIQADRTHAGSIFDSMAGLFASNDVIIGATNFSLITNRVTREALAKGARFLSLPLSTNNGQPALTFPFMGMDPNEAERLGSGMLEALKRACEVRVTTPLGTDLTFGKRGRMPGLFNGLADRPGRIGSSSFEIYVGVEETVTEGHGVVDGSLGYLGVPSNPIYLCFRGGSLVEIDGSPAGGALRQYMDAFHDPGIYVAGELGIGLNRKSQCSGNCYIEDESTFSTFHIGMGRNLALGGVHDAAGHFDLVFKHPSIYADGLPVMLDGKPTV